MRKKIKASKGLTGSRLSAFLFESNLDTARAEMFWRKKQWTAEQLGWCEWGSQHEDVALRAFLDAMPRYTTLEAPLTFHSDSPNCDASSPDGTFVEFTPEGRVCDFGVVEIKCPAKKKVCCAKPIVSHPCVCPARTGALSPPPHWSVHSIITFHRYVQDVSAPHIQTHSHPPPVGPQTVSLGGSVHVS